MNNLEYLNEISKDNRPTEVKSNTTSLILKIAIGGILAFALLIILGAVLNGGGPKSSELVQELYLRTTNLDTTVTTHGRSAKSSDLRAIGTSLSTLLSSTSTQLAAYLTATGADPAELDPEITASELAITTELENTLTNAKLNGIFNRIYYTQLQLQVSLLIGLINTNIEHTSDETLLAILTPYLANITTISTRLETYPNLGN